MRVRTEQFASRAGPNVLPSGSTNCWVWQKNGVWWGPEMMGPSMGQLRTVTEAVVPPPEVGTTVIVVAPTGRPSTTPRRAPGATSLNREVTSLPPAKTFTALAAVPVGNATRTSASPPLTNDGSEDRIWIGFSGSFSASVALVLSALLGDAAVLDEEPPPQPTTARVATSEATQSVATAKGRRRQIIDMNVS